MISVISLIAQGEYFQALISVLSRCFVVFCCMPIHECAHGYIAYKLGDNTAKNMGRLTLNPLKHLSPIGTIMIFLFGIGYANPVPINPNNFKKPKLGMALSALAGPVSNLIMASIASVVNCAIVVFCGTDTSGTDILSAVATFFYFSASVNIMLAVFNFFPIPPLDGSKILAAVLPDKAYNKYMMYERYIMIPLLIALFMGILDKPIMYLSSILMQVFYAVPYLVFSLIK